MNYVITIFFLFSFLSTLVFSDDMGVWPEIYSEYKPWTRWWWHGNAVDSIEIQRHLNEFARVGIGGVEITSIYGVKGREQNSIPYLSADYLKILDFTIEQAAQRGLGVDIPPGSGWRCGGLGLKIEDADARVVIEKDTVRAGEKYLKVMDRTPHALLAFSNTGERIDLIPFIQNATADWQPEKGDWIVYLVTQEWSGAKVKRPAPGGEGYSFNPYSKSSTFRMLQPFSSAFNTIGKENIRSIFHDSFEYSGDWTIDFFIEFENRRGYDLRDYLPELTGVGELDIIRRVKCDYRETISDLVMDDFIVPLQQWSHERGWLLRNQSHGSPANLLDLYGQVDIPETEIFRFDHDTRVLKFASSAANVMGKKLVSAESFTWQDEHFHVTLDTMKRSSDLLFVSGINHIFFHGTTYSPQNAEWPGWLFYASSQLNPQNTLWRDLPAFNSYITRCQSLLQTSAPDNDVLVYWPVYDFWSDPKGLNKKMTVHHPQWITENPAGYVAEKLTDSGLSYDFISDEQLKSAYVKNTHIAVSTASYQTIIVPECEFIPIETLTAIFNLAKNGATIVVENRCAQKVPGLKNWQTRQKLLSEMQISLPDAHGVCSIGSGRIIQSSDIEQTLEMIGLYGESFATFKELLWLRKKHASGHLYFLSNKSKKKIEGWIVLKRHFMSAFIFNPVTDKIGLAKGRDDNSLYLQLEAGESLFLKTYENKVDGAEWEYWRTTHNKHLLNAVWQVKFVDGGPTLPRPFTQQELKSWTLAGDPEASRFAGTARYSTTLNAPENHQFFRLELGHVAESARIVLNGQEVGTLFSHPYAVNVELEPLNNKLEIYVTNLAANRIRDLDRQGVEWRIFQDINFVNIDYKLFDASVWPVRDSGLLGPVTLTPVLKMEP